MRAEEILEHFLSRAPWVDRNNTVDRIILGDPKKEIKKVLVTWMSTLPAVRYAVENGFDMLMTHEPTFWIHANEVETLDSRSGSGMKLASSDLKRKFIEQNGLVVERNHDVWDRFPEIGIPWALARFLGVAGQPCASGNSGYQLAFNVEPASASDLAKRVAERTASIGEPLVQLFGQGSARVTKLGIGTGCCCRPDTFLEMGCDGAIICDDGCTYWHDVSWAIEASLPLVRIGHGTSEEPGMVTLTDYINENMPGVTAEHYRLALCVSYAGQGA